MEDGADDDFKLDYAEFFSVLMYYYGMSKAEILSHSRRFLYALYKQYGRRACENLGVSADGDKQAEKEGENAYPSEFKKLTKQERKRKHEELAKRFSSNEDFVKMFDGMAGQRAVR